MTIDLSQLQRIGQGRGAEIFALADGRVVKVAREGAVHVLDREAAALRAAHAAGMPVPPAYELVDVGGRQGLVMGRVRGADMLTQFARRPWTVLRAGGRLGALHARLHAVVAPGELPSARTMLEEKIASSPLVPTAARDRALGVLWQLPDGDRLCHFDFHPANVMTGAGGELTVIDWPGACRGDALADVAATTIILRGGKTTPGTAWITRALAPIGRTLLLRGYLRGYRRHGAFDRERFGRWLVVAAALRLSYGIAGEEGMLLELIAA
jgi:aminoglycoside phosphotransferase (APT) family kinase protein